MMAGILLCRRGDQRLPPSALCRPRARAANDRRDRTLEPLGKSPLQPMVFFDLSQLGIRTGHGDGAARIRSRFGMEEVAQRSATAQSAVDNDGAQPCRA
jgi:hypothetical protein